MDKLIVQSESRFHPRGNVYYYRTNDLLNLVDSIEPFFFVSYHCVPVSMMFYASYLVPRTEIEFVVAAAPGVSLVHFDAVFVSVYCNGYEDKPRISQFVNTSLSIRLYTKQFPVSYTHLDVYKRQT